MDCTFADDAGAVSPEWRGLSERSLVPSGLNSPELIAPALRNMGGARLAVVREGEKLHMALPVAEHRFPLPYLGNWTSPVSFYGLPHLDADMAVPALTAFLRKVAQPVLLHSVPRNGPLWDALTAASGHVAILDQWERAGLEIAGSYENWFETNFERKRRKEYRRLRSRLSEQGNLEALSLSQGENPATWVDELLAIEAAGWKGERGTAINFVPKAASLLRDAAAGLAASGKLRFWKLSLDGRVIASLYGIVEGNQVWLGKIAFDQNFARYSPGVLLILHATEQLFAEAGIARVDSCAIPGHPMIDNIWRDRIAVADVMIAHTNVSALRFATTVAAERLRRTLRYTARDIFYKLTGRHRS